MTAQSPTTMRRFGFLTALAVLFASLPLSVQAQAQEQSESQTSFGTEQTRDIEKIVHDYLLEHPEVIFEAAEIYQQRQKLAEEARRQEAITAYAGVLRGAPGDPVLGAPDGDVVLVEFFDYRCPYCRKVADTLRETVAEDGNVRLVMKELPILGPQSVKAARAALAAHKQDPAKYEAFHYALMAALGDMSDPQIRQIARDIGLDVEQLEADMQDPSVDEVIGRAHALAQALGISGTPAFVIGNTLVPGAIDQAALKRLISQARAKAS